MVSALCCVAIVMKYILCQPKHSFDCDFGFSGCRSKGMLHNVEGAVKVDQWRTQDFFFLGGGGFTPGIFSGGGVLSNLVAEKGQREWGSGGGIPLVRGSTQFANE
jgi:hypothetical protein